MAETGKAADPAEEVQSNAGIETAAFHEDGNMERRQRGGEPVEVRVTRPIGAGEDGRELGGGVSGSSVRD